MMGHGMDGFGVYAVLGTMLLVALLVLAVTATTWLIRNMMGHPRSNRANSDGSPTASGSD